MTEKRYDYFMTGFIPEKNDWFLVVTLSGWSEENAQKFVDNFKPRYKEEEKYTAFRLEKEERKNCWWNW